MQEKKPIAPKQVREKKPIALKQVREKKSIALKQVRVKKLIFFLTPKQAGEKDIYWPTGQIKAVQQPCLEGQSEQGRR